MLNQDKVSSLLHDFVELFYNDPVGSWKFCHGMKVGASSIFLLIVAVSDRRVSCLLFHSDSKQWGLLGKKLHARHFSSFEER